MLQDGADAGHPALAAVAGAGLDLRCRRPQRLCGGRTGSEWAAKPYLAQPVRQGAGGVWVITRTANPAGSYQPWQFLSDGAWAREGATQETCERDATPRRRRPHPSQRPFPTPQNFALTVDLDLGKRWKA